MIKRYFRFFFAAAIAAAFLSVTGCSDNAETKYSDEKFLMDTFISIEVYGADKEVLEKAVTEAFAEMMRLNNLTDRYPKKGSDAYLNSDVCRINESAGKAPVKVSEDVYKMMEISLDYYNKSHGAFDIAVGPLVDLWGFADDPPHKVPNDEEIKNALKFVNADWIQLDPDNKTVFLTHPGMILDLGAVAKGYAAELAAKKLKEYGIEHALVNAGGNIVVIGYRPNNEKWRIGVEDPRDRESIVGVLSLADEAAVTSGDYQRNFTVDNVVYHHILSPFDGKPARKTISVTVVTKDSGLADILSTTLFVMGPEEGMKLVEKLDGVEAVFVGSDMKIYISSGLKEKFKLKDNDKYQLAS